MADVTYKVEFSVTEDLEKKETEELTEVVSSSPTPKKARSTKKGLIDKKTAKTVVFAYSVYTLTSNFVAKSQMNNMTLRGDNLAAKIKQDKKSQMDKYVSTGFSLGMAIAMKGTLGILAIGMEAFKLASEAINIALENKNLIAQLQNEKYISALEQSRFIRNSTTEQLRW